MRKTKVEKFNERVAQLVSDLTGNMWFFWASLAFILVLRLSHPPSINEFLLNIENDLQLLLLAANAVVGAKQLSLMMRVLKHIEKEEKQIAKDEERLEGEIYLLRRPESKERREEEKEMQIAKEEKQIEEEVSQ